MIPYIMGGAFAIVLGIAIYLWFGGRKKVPEDKDSSDYVDGGDPVFAEEVVDDIIETTYEIIEEERLDDEEFENTVTKIRSEVHNWSDDDLVNYINRSLRADDTKHGLVTTADTAKFDWERESSL